MFSPGIQSWDERLLLSIQKCRFRFLTWVMIVLTWTAAGRVWVTVALLCNLLNRYVPAFNPYFLNAFFAPLTVWAINKLIKKKVRRDRPSIVNNSIIPLVKAPPCYSFPSSHAGSTFAFFFSLWWWQFPESRYFFLWAVIVSFSRLYLGVHYLTDIIGGIIIAGIAATITVLIF